jgi:hypothetical protein
LQLEHTPEEHEPQLPLCSDPELSKTSLAQRQVLGALKIRKVGDPHCGHLGSALSFIPFLISKMVSQLVHL